ncbi:MAG: DUF6754 domain-containing protein [Anaerolineaceae bacterium]
MNATAFLGLGVVVVCAGLMVAFRLIHRKNPQRGLREIPAYSHLRRAIGLAVEDGSRLHVSLGKAGLLSPQNTAGLVGLTVLERIAELSSLSDRPPVATSGDPSLAILSQDTLQRVYRDANALGRYESSMGRLTGVTPFSYAAGAMPAITGEQVSANMLIGNLDVESALLANAVDDAKSFAIGGSNSLLGQAVQAATLEEPLVGEEVYAAGAYLQAGPMHAASLRAQDILRWGIVAALILGAILKLAGVL